MAYRRHTHSSSPHAYWQNHDFVERVFFSGRLNFWVVLLKLSKHILTFVNKLVTMNRSMILLNVHKSNILSAKGF